MKFLYLNNLFFYTLFLVGFCFVLAFFFPIWMQIAYGILTLLLLATIVDLLLLFRQKKGISGNRNLPEKLSNGDENLIEIKIQNHYFFSIKCRILDEIPFQFQLRDFLIYKKLKSEEKTTIPYYLTPKERGIYSFGSLNIYVSSFIGLISKRYRFSQNASLPCYASFIHLRKNELLALQNEFLLGGVKKIRKLGHTMEFEQIKDYVSGDDLRNINWKTTSKHHKLMVNQYQDEKSQRIYMMIDKGRTMQMPFQGMTLLDYSINATMALSHIVLKKMDRAGMMTFSKKTENKVIADRKNGQLQKLAEALYHIETNFYESDFNRLYQDIKTQVGQRSLLLLFTNFETLDALQRQLKYLRGIAKSHILVVIFFQNTELENIIHKKSTEIQKIYDKIIAEKLEFEKKLIIQELKKYGIQTIYTRPENLNIHVINKYLEIKARGIL